MRGVTSKSLTRSDYDVVGYITPAATAIERVPCLPQRSLQLRFSARSRTRKSHTTERAASMQRGAAAGTTDRGSAEEGCGSASSDSDGSDDGNTDLSSDDELAPPPPH